MKKAVIIIVNALLIIVVIFSIALFVLAASFRGSSMILPYSLITVSSGSMSPKIEAGDVILIKKTNFSSLETGDVITFVYMNGIVTHEIKGINRNVVVTGGIAENTEFTEEVYRGDVVGKYTGVKLNRFGKLLEFIRSVWGFVIFIVVPLSTLFIVEIIELSKNVRKVN